MTMLLLLSAGVAVLAIALVITLMLLLRPKRETDVEEAVRRRWLIGSSIWAKRMREPRSGLNATCG